MNNINFPDIRSLVPHSGTMMLLDRVVSADENSLSAEVMIRSDSLFYSKDDNGVGTWVGVEYMAQTIAAYAGYNALKYKQAVKIGFLVGTRRYECSKAFFANGDCLHITARNIFQADNGLGSFECSIYHVINPEKNEGQNQIASAVINAFLPDDVNKFLEEYNI